MGFQKDTLNEWANTHDFTAAASAERTASGAAVVELADRGSARVELDVTAHDRTTGDETLDVDVETGPTDAGPWTTVGAFTQIAAQATPVNERIVVGPLDRYVRVVWTVAGTTPITTFAVTGEAV